MDIWWELYNKKEAIGRYEAAISDNTIINLSNKKS